jgi:hypothetical protein
MRSRCLFWWTGLSASVGLFIGQRLSALGQFIAQELERPYAGATGSGDVFVIRRWKHPLAFLRRTKRQLQPKPVTFVAIAATPRPCPAVTDSGPEPTTGQDPSSKT